MMYPVYYPTNLDLILVASALRHQVFNPQLYKLLGNDQDTFSYFSAALPKTFEQLSQLFGYNFDRTTHNTDPIFAETDIRNYVVGRPIEENILDLVGAETPFSGIVPPINLQDLSTSALTSSWFWNKNRAANASYNPFDAPYIADTQYFASNVPITGINGRHNFDLTLADSPGYYTVYSYYYSDSEVIIGGSTFYVEPALAFNFDIPENLAVGDNANITVTIKNGKGYALTITPTVSAGSTIINSNFNYDKWTLNAQNRYVSANANTYTLASSETEQKVWFRITGIVPTFGPSSVTFKFAVNRAGVVHNVFITKPINILYTARQVNQFASGLLTSFEKGTYPYKQNSAFSVRLPNIASNPFASFKFTIFPSPSSYAVYNSKRAVRLTTEVPTNLLELLGNVKKALSIEQTMPFDMEVEEYISIAYEAENFAFAMVK